MLGASALNAALAIPDGRGPHPGVLVIHEVFGLNDDMRRVADRLAAAGYAAIAPDLLSAGNRATCMARLLAEVARSGRGRALHSCALHTAGWARTSGSTRSVLP